MTTARLDDALVLAMPTKVGLLAEVTTALQGAGVDILAVMAHETPSGSGEFMFVTSDADLAEPALEKTGALVSRVPVAVLWMPDELGALDEAMHRIAEAGVDMFSVFATSSQSSYATVIVQSTDNEKVVGLF
jgi:hypothetical protein